MSEIKNIGQLIQQLASKAGVAQDDKNLINILSNAELSKVTLHSDLVKAIDENLISVTAAGDNHPSIGAKYKSEALDTVDKRLEKIIDAMETTDEEKARLKGIRSTYNRFDETINAINEVSSTKIKAAGKSDNTAMQKQIDDLQELLKTTKETATAAEKAAAEKISGIKTDYLFKGKLTGKKTIFDNLDSDDRHSSLMLLIEKALQDKDAKVGYDEKGVATLLKSDGSKLYGSNNTLLTLDDLIDSTLATKNVLVVSDPQNQNQNPQQQSAPTHVAGGQQKPTNGTNQAVQSFARQQREAYEKNAASAAYAQPNN